jgi:hypothetical protein
LIRDLMSLTMFLYAARSHSCTTCTSLSSTGSITISLFHPIVPAQDVVDV